MEGQEKKFPSYMGEFFAANPTKFEERKNHVKPKIYLGLAVLCGVIVIFPGFIPVAGWLVRTAGVIGAVVCLFTSWMSGSSTYNLQSGGEIKDIGVKKFKRDETDMERIIKAFAAKDFEYLAGLPGGRSEPVQLHIHEDRAGRELYCHLTTYLSSHEIVGLADVITLSGNDYEDNVDLLKQMLKEEEDN